MTKTTKVFKAFRLDPDLIAQMQSCKAETGMPESEQVRRALREWFGKRQGATPGRRSPRSRQSS